MMFDRDSNQHNRQLWPAALLIAVCVLSGSVTTAQESASQRHLIAPYSPRKPLEQLRILMQQQQLKRPLQMPPIDQLRNALNLSDEQLRQLTEAFQRSGMIPPNMPALSEDGSIEGLDAESILQNLRRSQQAQPSRTPDTSSPRSPLNTPPDAAARNSNAPPSGTQRAENTSSNRPSDGTPAESDRSRSSSRNEISRPATRPTPSGRPSEGSAAGQSGGSDGILGMAPEIIRRLNESRPQTPPASSSSAPSAGPSFDLGDELSQRGVRRTFRRLVQDVRKKVSEQSTAAEQDEPSEPSVFNRAIAGLFDSVRDDVVETVRNTQQQRAERSRERRRRERDDAPNQSSGFDLAATESPTTAAGGTSSASPSDSGGGISSAMPDDLTDLIPAPDISSGSQMLIILAGLAIAAIAVLLSARRQTLTEHQRRSRALQALKPDQIRSREDVIRAFHWLTLYHSPDAAEWWNHLQAGESLAQQSGSRQESLQQLMELYEIARYRSADTALEPAQLQRARTALAGCLS